MRGRKPKPTALKRAEGNPGGRKLNDAEPKPTTPGLPERPDHLDAEAAKEWDRVAAQMPAGWIVQTDRAVLAAYCQAWGQHVEATRQMSKHGLVVKSPSGYPIQNPYLSISKKALADTVRYAAELGFSPSSRSRISHDPPPPAGDADEFDL